MKTQNLLKKLFVISQYLNILVSIIILISSTSPVFAQDYTDVTKPKGKGLGTIEGFGGFIPKLFGSGDFTKPEGIGGVFERVFSTLLAVFTIIGGMMFIIYFAIGSLAWVSAGGDQEKIKKAQAQMTNGLLGLIVLVGAYSFFYLIGLILGFDFLKPATLIEKLNPITP